MVCVCWFRKRRKAGEHINAPVEENINNQRGACLSLQASYREDRRSVTYPLDRIGDGAEKQDDEDEDSEEEGGGTGMVVDKCPSLKYTKGEVMYTVCPTVQTLPLRTHYNTKDNRCKDVNRSERVSNRYL